MTRAEAESKLKELFRIDTFYEDQWSTISRILYYHKI